MIVVRILEVPLEDCAGDVLPGVPFNFDSSFMDANVEAHTGCDKVKIAARQHARRKATAVTVLSVAIPAEAWRWPSYVSFLVR